MFLKENVFYVFCTGSKKRHFRPVSLEEADSTDNNLHAESGDGKKTGFRDSIKLDSGGQISVHRVEKYLHVGFCFVSQFRLF